MEKNGLLKKISAAAVSVSLAATLGFSSPLLVTASAQEVKQEVKVESLDSFKFDVGTVLNIVSTLLDSKIPEELSQINWTNIINSDIDWVALFNGEESVLNVLNQESAFKEILKLAESLTPDSEKADQVYGYLEKLVESKYFNAAVDKIFKGLDSLLKGDTESFKEMLNLDFEALRTLLKKGDTIGYLRELVNKYPELEKYFNGDFSLVSKLVSGDYTFLKDILNGDFSFLSEIVSYDPAYAEALLNGDYAILKDLLGNKSEYAEYLIKGDFEGLVSLIGTNSPYAEAILNHDAEKILEFLCEECPELKKYINKDFSWVRDLLNGDLTGFREFLTGLDYEKLGLSSDKVDINAIVALAADYLPEIQALVKGENAFAERIKSGDYSQLLDIFERVCKIVDFDNKNVTGKILDYLPMLTDSGIVTIVKQLLSTVAQILPESARDVVTKIINVIDNVGDVVVKIEEIVGDLNGDDEVTLIDVVETQRIIADLKDTVTYDMRVKADVSQDGKVNLNDVVLMQQYIARLIVSF